MQAGDVVFLAASVLGPTGSFVIHEDQPQFGIVESTGAGSPPVDVVVVWQDGRRVQYSVVGSGATSVLFHLGAVASGFPIISQFAQPKAGTGIPNPGGRLQGPIIQHFGLEDPTGVLVGEVIVIDTPIGFLVIAPTDATIVPAA
jgi:hypothetical protein